MDKSPRYNVFREENCVTEQKQFLILGNSVPRLGEDT